MWSGRSGEGSKMAALLRIALRADGAGGLPAMVGTLHACWLFEEAPDPAGLAGCLRLNDGFKDAIGQALAEELAGAGLAGVACHSWTFRDGALRHAWHARSEAPLPPEMAEALASAAAARVGALLAEKFGPPVWTGSEAEEGMACEGEICRAHSGSASPWPWLAAMGEQGSLARSASRIVPGISIPKRRL